MKYILIKALIIGIFIVPSYAQLITDGLVYYYPLNNGSALDLINDSNGAIAGVASPGSDRHGNPNAALRMGSNSFIIIPGLLNTLIVKDTSYSMSFWFKREALIRDDYEVLLNKDTLTNPMLPNRQSFGIYQKSKLVFSDCIHSIAIDSLSTWNHIVLTYNYGDRELYVNSNLACSSSMDYIEDNLGITFIGGRFDGILDDVLFYNRVLNSDEIKLLFSGQTTSSNSPQSTSSIEKFNTYPNPFTDCFFIESNLKGYTVSVVDLVGKIFHYEVVDNQTNTEIVLSGCPNGIYYIVIRDKHGKIIHAKKVSKA